MVNLTQDDLKLRTDAELASLFRLAADQQDKAPNASIAFNTASLALRLIRAELARRGLSL
jgi:hypothetical protein